MERRYATNLDRSWVDFRGRFGHAGTVRLNLLEVGRATLQPRLMTKHSPFSYIKPGPGLLNRLAQAHGLEAKSHEPTVIAHAPSSCL